MTNEELAEALEDLAANRAGGTAAESNYDPELLVTMMEAAARLRQQSEDSARLDWLERESMPVFRIDKGAVSAGVSLASGWICGSDFVGIRASLTIRDAIDKARHD